MHELSERGPAWAKLPEDWPQLPHWSLRVQLAARQSPPAPSPEQLRRWRAEADRTADQLGRYRRRGAVAEQRVAEALRARATGSLPSSGWPVSQDNGSRGVPTEAGRADTRPPRRNPRR